MGAPERYHRAAILQLLVAIALSTSTASVWAASECELHIEALPSDTSTLITGGAKLSCTGDPVAFTVGLNFNPANEGGEPPGQLQPPHGTVTFLKDYSYFMGYIELADAVDVVFTSVVIKYYDYSFDAYALQLRNCSRCELRNVTVENLPLQSLSSAISIVDSADVTIDGAAFTGLGQFTLAAGFASGGSALGVVNSGVTLRDVTFTGLTISSQGAVTVTGGGRLTASRSTWQDMPYSLTTDPNIGPSQGRAIFVRDTGSLVTLQDGCTISGVEVQPAAAGALVGSLIHVSLGGSAIISPDSTLFIPAASASNSGLAVLTDAAASLTLDGRSLRSGTLQAPLGLPVSGQALRLDHDGGNVLLSNISFAGQDFVRPYLVLRNSNATLTDCTFTGLRPDKSVDIDVNSAVVINVGAASIADVTHCTFTGATWATETETQMMRVADGGILRLSDSSFSGLRGCGTALRATNGSTLQLTRTNFTDVSSVDSAEKRASVVIDGASTLSAVGSMWKQVNAGNSTNGAALSAIEPGAVTLSGCIFEDIYGPDAPAVQLLMKKANTSLPITVTGCTFKNTSTSAALSIDEPGSVVQVADTTFTDCQAVPKGGGALRFAGCSNSTSSTHMTLNNVTFTRNSAQLSGGALQSIGCNVVTRNSVFTANTAGSYGAGVSVLESGSMSLDNCTFVANTIRSPDGGLGGAVYVDKAAVQITGCTFTRNTALGDRAAGGAVWCQNSRATVTGSTFFANAANMSGGALAVKLTPLKLQDSVFTGNIGNEGAGLALLEATVDTSMSAMLTSANLPPPPSPPMPPSPSPPAPSNASAGPAQGVLVESYYSEIYNTTFTQNNCREKAGRAGGAVYATVGLGPRWKLLVYESTFISNSCPNGGAIASNSLDKTSVIRSDFKFNRAVAAGGAISFAASAFGSYGLIQENTFTNNTAKSIGGALESSTGATMGIYSNSFRGNGNMETDIEGGAVYLENCKNLPGVAATEPNIYMRFNNYTFNQGSRGAAVFARICNISMYEERFISNIARGAGGAVQAVNTLQSPLTTLLLTNVYAMGNIAGQSGGAMSVLGQGLTVIKSTFVGNRASIVGGAISILDASPNALKFLQRKTIPFYTPEEEYFLRVAVENGTFTDNWAEAGGGALYLDSSALLMQGSSFTNNSAGDGFPNDEWSDGGGAIMAATCWNLVNVFHSNFTGNRAIGGPAGGILQIGSSFILESCRFDGNVASTYGGAIAAADRRRNDTTMFDTPNLVIRNCHMTKNTATAKDGGAVLTRDMNATVFLSYFGQNTAGGSGGALAFLNNLDTGFLASDFEDNSAGQYGGAAYLLTTPFVSIKDSNFRRNHASRTGGALSIVKCSCTLTSRSLFDGNYVEGRGGAMHLQPPDSEDGNVNHMAERGDCVGHFLTTVKQRMSPQGRELLGTTDHTVESYNATIVYDFNSLNSQSIGIFGRGGIRLPVPDVRGPAQLFGFDVSVRPAAGSTATLAAGSSFPFADWSRFTIYADARGTRLLYLDADTGTQLSSGEVVELAAGSALTVLSSSMAALPTNMTMLLNSGTVWRLDNGTVLQPDNDTLAFTIVPGVRSQVALAGGTTSVADWNRYALWTGSAGSFMYDARTGTAQRLESASVTIANGSPMLRHSRGESTLATGAIATVQPGGAAWALANGTVLTAGGSIIAVTAVPANGSTVAAVRGSLLTVTDWNAYTLRLGDGNGTTSLVFASDSTAADIAVGTAVTLTGGSAITSLGPAMEMLPAGLSVSVQGSSWVLSNGTSIAPGGGVVAFVAVVPAGSRVRFSDQMTITVGEADWNRYSLWAGPLGTLLQDTTAGVAYPLSDAVVVTLGKSTALSWHTDAAVVDADTSFTVRGSSWVLSSGRNLTRGASKVALAAVPGILSRLVLADGRTVNATDWYRYLVWAGESGSFLFDTATDTSTPLADGSTVYLARGSMLFVHDSATAVVAAAGAQLTVQAAAWTLAANGGGAPATLSASSDVTAVVVVLASGSTVALGGAAGAAGTVPLSIRDNKSILWASAAGTVLYDSVLGASVRLAAGSTASLAAGSLLLVHDSATTVLPAAANLTVRSSGTTTDTWGLSNGQTLTLGGGTVAMATAPGALSNIVFNNAITVPIATYGMFALWAGRYGTLLYNHNVEASYALTEGSTLTLAANSTIAFRDGLPEVLPAGTTVTVRGGAWLLGNGTRIDPGDGVGEQADSQYTMHTPRIQAVADEIGRTCAADFTTAQYQANAYAYDYRALEKLIVRWIDEFSNSNIAPQVASAAYGYALTDSSGFNGSLLIPGYLSGRWDRAGRPSSAPVTCTATAAPAATSKARGLSMLHLGITAINNRAESKGGAMVIDGGHGRILVDSVTVFNNTVKDGDGGGLALYQDDDQMNMQLEVYITSSNFSSNTASSGAGGALSLIADNLHQQVVFINTTIDRNVAAIGGGVAIYNHISVLFNSSVISNNRGDSNGLSAGAAARSANDPNRGHGGGIMASGCNEIQVTHGSWLHNNNASARGGGLSAVGCALVMVNTTKLEHNTAQSAGGLYIYNSLPVLGTYQATDRVGATIAIVAKSNFTDNTAVSTKASNDLSDGYGGGVLTRGRVSTLLADSYFQGNIARLQGGSIFIQSECNLDKNSWFLARNLSTVTAFTSASESFRETALSLEWARPKGCWGTVVYLPQFFNNEAALSGGALFASHPEALSLACDNSNATAAATNAPIIYNQGFSEAKLAGRVLEAMQLAAFQVLDNRVVTRCYRQELQKLQDQLEYNTTDLTGNQLSTLNINDNRAKGYGYLIGIVPSKLRIINVSWTGNTSNVARQDDMQLINNLLPGVDTSAAAMQASGGGSSDDSGSISAISSAAGTLRNAPFFNTAPGEVWDEDTGAFRRIVNYHITTLSNEPMNMPILLLDALDQVASENTTLRQAQVRARYENSTNGCFAELLGGIEGSAYNGTALMRELRLRALKGENYSVSFKVEDQEFAGTVEPLIVNVTVPACSIGEVPRDKGYMCQKCDVRSFSLWEDTEPLVNCTYPNQADITCMPCPDDAECWGGAVVVASMGFWQSAANSTFMNACPNSEACRDGDDEAQDMLIRCQEWWYSRPAGFNYTAYVESVLTLTEIGGIAPSNGALTLSGNPFNASDPDDLCLLWGLPFDHPAAYARKQCAEGYSGNLCAVCIPVDGVLYAGQADFSCSECFSGDISILVAVAGFVANVVTVLVTVVLTFMADYTEDEDMAIGDLVKVLIVHLQFFCIVTRLNIDWPKSVSGFTSALSALTGAVSGVYSPSCLLSVDASPAEMARVDQLAALITPLVVVLAVALLWLLRYMLFNFRSLSRGTKDTKDMRTIEEYKNDRATRAAQRRLAAEAQMEMDDMAEYGEDDEDDDEMRTGQAGDLDGLQGHQDLVGMGSDALNDLRNHFKGDGDVNDNDGTHGSINDSGTTPGTNNSSSTVQPDAEVSGGAPGGGDDAGVAHIGLIMGEELAMPPPPSAPLPPPAAPPPLPPATEGKPPAPSEADVQPATPGALDDVAAGDAITVATSESGLPRSPPASSGSPAGRPPTWPRPIVTAVVAPSSPAIRTGGPISSPAAAAAAAGLAATVHRPSNSVLKTGPSMRTGRSRVSFDEHGGAASDGAGTPSCVGSRRGGSAAATAAAVAGEPYRSSDNGLAAPPPRSSFRQQRGGAGSITGMAGPANTISNAAYNSDSGVSTPTHGGRDRLSPMLHTIHSVGHQASAALAAAAAAGDGASDAEKGNAGGFAANSVARGPGRAASSRSRTASRRGTGPSPPGSNAGGGGSAKHMMLGQGGSDKTLDGRSTHYSMRNSMRRRLTASTVWVRNFFTYDEEAVDEGEIRWASLANIDRTMVWWRQMLLVVMIACFILYPAWAQATLMIFACYFLDDGTGPYPDYQLAQWGKGYWLLNMNQECYAGEHARVWVPLGVACIFIICLGIPFLTFMVTFVHRTTLHSVHVVQTYGFLYRRYNYDRYYWWESVMQLQTLLLVIVDVFGRVLVVYQQAVLLMIVLMLIMWSNMYYQPLKHEILDQMSSMSLAVLSFTVALGLFFVPPADRKDPVTPMASAAIGGIILAMNIGLLIYFVYVMVTHGRDAIDRGVVRAREQMLAATSKMTLGLHVVRDRMSNGARNLRALTSRSLTSVQDKVMQRRRFVSTPNLHPAAPLSEA